MRIQIDLIGDNAQSLFHLRNCAAPRFASHFTQTPSPRYVSRWCPTHPYMLLNLPDPIVGPDVRSAVVTARFAHNDFAHGEHCPCADCANVRP
jgi:hypothetical protein